VGAGSTACPERPRESDARPARGIGQEARVPDADEAAREDVVPAGVVAVGEGHPLALEGKQAVIADIHPMGVAPEVARDRGTLGCCADRP